MKFLVFGAGAVGGVVGARLAQAGHDVRVVARGAHAAAIRAQGLVVHAPNGTDVVPVPVVDEPAVDDTTIVLLAVKTQDVADALRALAIAAPPTTPVVCMTNGLAAEPQAARWFTHVYGMCVNTPSTYLEPGVVLAWGEPVAGMYDIGRFPAGRDATCDGIAAAFEAAHLWSRSDADIMRWKRGKLLFNLSNALDALCGPAGRTHPLVAELRAEGERVYAAAGLSTTTVDETTARQGAFRTGTLPAYSRVTVGGSTWQSLARGAHVLECEYLNGEIALLGRIHGVPTPANDGVLRAVTRAAAGAGTP
ncbi:MAG TPA: 2-dehydropantoate 2-reductase N-terminal domain-containing protein, partial [Kofleriaceae bacterium]|nr:2-dehydropantoate 2-reductase N-terminal domain-containing protein [Kofleriaceae bacterium]